MKNVKFPHESSIPPKIYHTRKYTGGLHNIHQRFSVESIQTEIPTKVYGGILKKILI